VADVPCAAALFIGLRWTAYPKRRRRSILPKQVLDEARRALKARDPDVIGILVRYLNEEPVPESPIPDNAYTFPKFLAELNTRDFRRKNEEEQKVFRQQRIAALEADTAAPLPERYRLGEILIELWNAEERYSRDYLLQLIREVPLVYGPWKALKRIFKESEAKSDMTIYGALAARFDMALGGANHSVSHRTLGYLCRQAWRTLRRIGERLPSCYADTASDFLCHYSDQQAADRDYKKTWIFNQILFHETGSYGGSQFLFGRFSRDKGRIQRPSSFLKHRAFAEAWQRSPRPLFGLLQEAQSEVVRQYDGLQVSSSRSRAKLGCAFGRGSKRFGG
jgi:hypothetical protein